LPRGWSERSVFMREAASGCPLSGNGLSGNGWGLPLYAAVFREASLRAGGKLNRYLPAGGLSDQAKDKGIWWMPWH
jgi:hypothetical protein